MWDLCGHYNLILKGKEWRITFNHLTIVDKKSIFEKPKTAGTTFIKLIR